MSGKRRIVFLSIFLAASLSLGLATAYFNEIAPETDPGEEHSEDVAHDEENNKEIEEQITHFFYLARNYEQSGDLSRAVENYKKVLQIDPQNYRTMNNIAALFIKMNLWEESLDYLQNSFKLKNNYVPTLINLGIVYAKKERTSEAESSLLKAISLEEENRAALFNIAVLYENQGAYDRAREYYQRLKILGKSEGMEGLRRLENK